MAPPECTTNANCEDGLGCTVDTCETGTCVSAPLDCGDGVCLEGSGCVECSEDNHCNAGDVCEDNACVTPVPTSITVEWEWPVDFNIYHLSFMGFFCEGGTLSGEGKNAEGCKNSPQSDSIVDYDWQELDLLTGDPVMEPFGGSFEVSGPGWLFFNPIYQDIVPNPNKDWCDSPTGFSTGVKFIVKVDGVELDVGVVGQLYNASGCNGRVYIDFPTP